MVSTGRMGVGALPKGGSRRGGWDKSSTATDNDLSLSDRVRASSCADVRTNELVPLAITRPRAPKVMSSGRRQTRLGGWGTPPQAFDETRQIRTGGDVYVGRRVEGDRRAGKAPGSSLSHESLGRARRARDPPFAWQHGPTSRDFFKEVSVAKDPIVGISYGGRHARRAGSPCVGAP